MTFFVDVGHVHYLPMLIDFGGLHDTELVEPDISYAEFYSSFTSNLKYIPANLIAFIVRISNCNIKAASLCIIDFAFPNMRDGSIE